MRITAAVKHKDRDQLVVEEVELDSPREDEILVRIAGVGLCHTDVVGAQGAFEAMGCTSPAMFGHEGSGVVEAVGSAVESVVPGDRVAMTFRSCGSCDRCRDGDAAYCRTWVPLNFGWKRPDGTAALRCVGDDGDDISSNFFGQSSFASHALAYERNVVKVPDDSNVALELLGPLGCSVQTGVGGVINSLGATEGSSILITGGGPVGLSAVMGAKIQRCSTVIVLEPIEARRNLAKDFGATHTLDSGAIASLPEAIRGIVPEGVDYALDTTGAPTVLSDVMNCLGSKGVFGIVGISPPGTPVPGEMGQVMMMGHTIKGIIEGDSNPKAFIPELIAHHKAGRLPFDRMIKTYPLGQINEAIADQHAGDCVKVVLTP